MNDKFLSQVEHLRNQIISIYCNNYHDITDVIFNMFKSIIPTLCFQTSKAISLS